jgi:hypothetical protein
MRRTHPDHTTRIQWLWCITLPAPQVTAAQPADCGALPPARNVSEFQCPHNEILWCYTNRSSLANVVTGYLPAVGSRSGLATVFRGAAAAKQLWRAIQHAPEDFPAGQGPSTILGARWSCWSR